MNEFNYVYTRVRRISKGQGCASAIHFSLHTGKVVSRRQSSSSFRSELVCASKKKKDSNILRMHCGTSAARS